MHPLFVLFLITPSLAAQPAGPCHCDPSKPETMQDRQCSLCREAEKQPGEMELFYLKDNNPRKPNRWLVLTRRHADGLDGLGQLTAKERTAIWTAAIRKAKELWGEEWGVAYNGDVVRTQCHMHLHIGKLLGGLEGGKFAVVSRVEDIPLPKDGTGLWVHPDGKRMHVHLNEQICETVLLR